MPKPPPRREPDLAELLPEWRRHLMAERKSPATRKVYEGGVRAFLRWCEQQGRPAVLDRATVNAYIADMLDQGAEGNSAKVRQLALRRFAAWLVDEGELGADLQGPHRPVRPPDRPGARPLPPAASYPRAGRHPGVLARRQQQDARLVRAAPGARAARRPGRHRRVPPPRPAPHRGAPNWPVPAG